MAVDPTDPETFDNEQAAELDEEVPEADAAEQNADVRPEEDDPLEGFDPDSAAEANEADAAEQARIVALDEDDYR